MTKQKNNINFKITYNVYSKIREFIGKHPAERGMMLGRDKHGDGIVRYAVEDINARTNATVYDPDIEYMNNVLKEWKKKNIEFIGFVHSHPPGIKSPSGHDHWYAGEILNSFKGLEKMFMPIVQTEPDTGKFEIIPHAVFPSSSNRKKVRVIRTNLSVVGNPNLDTTKENIQSKPTYKPSSLISSKFKYDGVTMKYGRPYGIQKFLYNTGGTFSESTLNMIKSNWNLAERKYELFFQRYNEHYDLNNLDKTRLIIIGTGGAASFIKNCARMGFGEFVIIDPDTISESNVATQDANPSDIGAKKVDSIAKSIISLNPKASVITFPTEIENINDNDFGDLIKRPIRWNLNGKVKSAHGGKGFYLEEEFTPRKTVLLVLTDNFEAQARGHRLGLHFGIPTICAQEYVEGIGAEVTYTVPGITPACHRCITASRYKSYLEDGYKNDVTSSGAPIFAAEFLNSVLGHVLLAITHHGTNHPRWGNVIEELGNRNLLRLRMDRSFDERFGTSAFSSRINGVSDPGVFHSMDTIFLKQTPDSGQSVDRPVCPDCGGIGDLTKVKGTFVNTEELRY